MGLLTERGVPEWHPADKEIVSTCRKAVEYCKTKKAKIEQLAVKYSTGNTRIPTTLVSTANPENLLNTIKWAENPMDEVLLKEVLDILQPVHRKTWDNS